MIKSSVSIKGIDGLFDAAMDEVMDAVNANLEQVADIVYQQAKATTAFHDKTGTLRRKIAKKGSRFDNGGFIVEARAPHAHLVEYGHGLIAWGNPTGKRVPAHPFLRPAKEVGLQKAIQLFRQR